MTVPRIYFRGGMDKDDHCRLGEESLRYVKSVLRMKTGDHLILFDGSGWEYETVIKNFFADGVSVEIVKKNRIPDKILRITLLQSLPKANKMDFIIQKATELGVDRIVPFFSMRSIPQLTRDKARVRMMRWLNIATEAARKCGRADIPEIHELLSFEEMLLYGRNEELNIIFWEEESEKDVKQVLQNEKYNGVKNVSVVIGPEGGFSKEEVRSAVDRGFISVSLGSTILKVETAVLAILSVIQYEKGMLGGLRTREVT